MQEQPSPPSEEHRDLDEIRNALRAYHSGVLLADDAAYPMRFVLDPATGIPLIAVSQEALDASAWVLFVPEESDDAFQFLCSLTPSNESQDAALIDRWLAHHSHVQGDVFAYASIDSIKRIRDVWEADELLEPSSLIGVEGLLLRELNSDQPRLIALLDRMLGLQTVSPVAVAVDQLGIDVRTRFDIVRIRFGSRCDDEASAAKVIDALLGTPETSA